VLNFGLVWSVIPGVPIPDFPITPYLSAAKSRVTAARLEKSWAGE